MARRKAEVPRSAPGSEGVGEAGAVNCGGERAPLYCAGASGRTLLRLQASVAPHTHERRVPRAPGSARCREAAAAGECEPRAPGVPEEMLHPPPPAGGFENSGREIPYP